MSRLQAAMLIALLALVPACASSDDASDDATVDKDRAVLDVEPLGSGTPTPSTPAADAATASTPSPDPAPTATPSTSEPTAAPLQIGSDDPATLPAYEVVDVSGDDTLNVRAAPGVGNTVIDELAPWATGISRTGRFATIDGTEWWEVMVVGEREGWVSSRFLQPATDPDRVPRFTVVDVPDDDTLNVRSGPGTGNDIVFELPPGASGLISSEVVGDTHLVGDDVWWQVYDPDFVYLGWVHSGFLAYEGRY